MTRRSSAAVELKIGDKPPKLAANRLLVTNYDRLSEFLKGRSDEQVTLSFDDIERLLNATLPPSARKYAAWWSSNMRRGDQTHVQARAWMDAGWKAVPDFRLGRVAFQRTNAPSTQRVKAVKAPSVAVRKPKDGPHDENMLQEDRVKEIIEQHLRRTGWSAKVAMGHEHGIDIEAFSASGERWIIEAKGCGSLNPMRVNYFLMILGELMQRMNDPKAKYSIALPDLPQFRRLWQRLPDLAKTRLAATCLFVTHAGSVEECG
jgi:hypothetical protein